MFPNKINSFENMFNPMQMGQGFGVMGGINPMTGNRQMGIGINFQCMGQMGFNPFCVNPAMMPFMMGMTQEQKKSIFKNARIFIWKICRTTIKNGKSC